MISAKRIAALRPAAFLDRDGTIIVEREYLADPDGVELLPGAAQGLRMLRDAGYALVVVTNQSGIARGLISGEAFEAVQERLAELLEAEGVQLDGAYHCAHHPDFTGPCECRKPGAAMFLRAADENDIDIERSVFIGDRLRDVAPARSLGAAAILVRTGYGRFEERDAPDHVVVTDDVLAAAKGIGAS